MFIIWGRATRFSSHKFNAKTFGRKYLRFHPIETEVQRYLAGSHTRLYLFHLYLTRQVSQEQILIFNDGPRNSGLTGLGTVGLTGLGTVGLTGLGTVGLTGLGTVG